MAKEDIVFSAKIDQASGAKSLSDLKKEFKDLQKELSTTQEGTDKYIQTLKKLGAVKDDMGDLRDTINAFNPEGKIQAFANVAGKLAGGFQAATGAAALFGAESEELQKTLLKVQAATAFAEGIQSLTALGDSFRVLGTVIKTNVVTALTTLKGAIIATGIGALAVAIGVLIYKTQEYNEAIEEEYDKQRKLNEELERTNDNYLKAALASERLRDARKGGLNELERELKLLEASGATADEIAKKKQDILDAEIFNLKVRSKTLDEDAKQQLELQQQILDKENEKQALILANEKRKADEAKKLREERKAQEERDFQDAITRGNKEDDEEADRNEKDREKAKKEREEDAKFFEEQDKLRLDAEAAQKEQDERNQIEIEKLNERENKRLEDKIAKEKAAAQEIANIKLQIENASVGSLKAVSDLYFQSQLNNAKGNAKQELEIRKKQFEVEKAFNLARVAIDGVRSVQAALTIPPPFGPALAILNGITAGVNFAKIANTQFSGGTASASAPSTASTSSAPNIQTSAPNVTSPTTQLSESGKNLSVAVEVVETQSTRTQQRVKRLQDQSTFP